MSLHWLGVLPIAVVTLMDAQNLLSWSRRLVLDPAERGTRDFTVLIPLYGKLDYFAGRDKLAAVLGGKSNVLVLCGLNTPAMYTAADTLESEGWRVLRLRPELRPRERLAAPRLLLAALESGAVTTTYVARLDADTALTPGFERAVEAVRRDGADLCSVKCHVLEPRSLCEKLQALEYRMAMLSRHFRPRLTSGACYVARTDALLEVMRRHTGVFFSEDVETGRIAFQLRYRIRHVDYEVLTKAPDTWRKLWRQRISWWAGNTHHFWVNLDHNLLQLPAWTLYYVALVWAGLWFKWESIIQVLTEPRRAAVFLLTAYALYVVITYAANWQVRSRWMLLIPWYSTLQALLMPPVGFCRWCYFCWTTRRVYRYRLSHHRRSPLPPLRVTA